MNASLCDPRSELVSDFVRTTFEVEMTKPHILT